MGHAMNQGVVTNMKGVIIEGFRVTGLNVANGQLCTIAEDCKSGLFTSVTHTSTGVYTVQMSLPYPPKLVTCQPSITNADGATALLFASYKSNSYNATTGQFIIVVQNLSSAATNGNATDELHITLKLRRYTN